MSCCETVKPALPQQLISVPARSLMHLSPISDWKQFETAQARRTRGRSAGCRFRNRNSWTRNSRGRKRRTETARGSLVAKGGEVGCGGLEALRCAHHTSYPPHILHDSSTRLIPATILRLPRARARTTPPGR